MGKITKRLTLGLTVLLFISLVFTACSKNDSKDEGNSKNVTVLNAVSFIAKGDPVTVVLEKFIEDVEKSTNGEVQINWRGGADIIPVNEQFEALHSGAIDINFGYLGQYQSLAPETQAIMLSELDPWDERENGFYDLMVERFKTINSMYLGRWAKSPPRLWLNEPVQKLEDLKGLKIRSAPSYNDFFDQLGISSVLIDPSEVYTSLQTGIAEGFVYGGLLGIRTNGWSEISKYALDHPFWFSQTTTTLMNLDTWDKLSKEHQQAIIEASARHERNMAEYYEEETGKERALFEEAGVTFITFDSDEDGKKFVNMAAEAQWSFIENHRNPEVPADLVAKLRQLTSK